VKRAREDKALEVWVGSGRELAGWLTDGMFKNVPMSLKDVLVTIDVPDGSDNWLQETRGFELTPVQQTFDRCDYPDDKSWPLNEVPLYAAKGRLSPGVKDEVRFAWRVLRLDQDDYDWLFDHPDFVPVDTEEDTDFRATEEGMTAYLRGDIEDVMNNAFLNGSVAAYGTGGLHTVNSASFGSANDSVMTLEKLTKSIRLAMGK
jgi:hypothetical protein